MIYGQTLVKASDTQHLAPPALWTNHSAPAIIKNPPNLNPRTMSNSQEKTSNRLTADNLTEAIVELILSQPKHICDENECNMPLPL